MKITITLDNVPTTESAKQIRQEIKNRRTTVMQVLRNSNTADIYVQFQAWLAGLPNQKLYKTFLNALEKEGIVTEVEKLTVC